MSRRRDELRRRKPFAAARPSVLICCEGKVTEPSYLKGLKNDLQIHLVRIEVLPAGPNPKTVVDYAVDKKQEAQHQARRKGDANLKYDEVWCVFDVDSHAHIPDAKQKADAHGIHMAISNPCFELWLLLHFQDQRRYVERHHVQSTCRGHIPGYDKKVPFDKLSPYYQTALLRAVNLSAWQKDRGCEGENPSTAVHKLTERIRELGREEQLKKHQRARR